MDGARNAGNARIWMNPAGIGWPLSTPAPEIEARTLAEVLTILQTM